MNILVLGSGGMLGHLTTIYLREKGHNVKDLSFPKAAFNDSFVCNVCDTQKLAQFIDYHEFDMIINCIALLIRESEQNKSQAVYLNSYFPHWLEKKYENTKTKIVQVSTDGVFGSGKAPFDENAPQMNTSFYARSKSLGELDNTKDLTIRSSYFGPDMNEGGKGLLNWFLSQKGEVKGFKKAIFTGVTSLEFAKFVDTVAFNSSGIYNLGASSPISKYDLLSAFKKRLQLDEINIIADSEYSVDTSVLTSRKDILYNQINYDIMINELCDYIENHKEYYPHYNLK